MAKFLFVLVLFEDLKLKDGTVIPAGAIIVIPIQLVQMDSSNWGSDAVKFNPCRFLSSTDGRCLFDREDTLTGNTNIVKPLHKQEQLW